MRQCLITYLTECLAHSKPSVNSIKPSVNVNCFYIIVIVVMVEVNCREKIANLRVAASLIIKWTSKSSD